MSKLVAPRLSLLAVAAALVAAACSSDTTAPSSPTIASPSKDIVIADGRPSAGNVEVCINPASPAGTYTVTASGTVTPPSIGTPNSPVDITLPGANCAIVFTRSNPQQPDPQNAVTTTVTSYPAGSQVGAVNCMVDSGADTPDDCTEPDGGAVEAIVYANAFHGTQVTFTFFNAGGLPLFVIGDTEPHGIGTNVYFWGSQWWKNNTMSGFVAKGVASFKGYASEAGTCGDEWISRVGNSPPPPQTIASQIGIIVTTTVGKFGPDIGGDILQILLVDVDPGYGPNPGHKGTGTVVGVLCTAQ
jgi:hypothetical protein